MKESTKKANRMLGIEEGKSILSDEERRLPENCQLIQFKNPTENYTAGSVKLKIPITIFSPNHFRDYVADAIDIVDKAVKEDGLSPMGLSNLLAALNYVILEKEYRGPSDEA